MEKKILGIFFILLIMGVACRHESMIDIPAGVTPPIPGSQEICFESDVLPIFVSNCAKSGCHDATSHKGGIRTYDYTGIMKGIISKNPAQSKYWQVIVTNDPGDRMPPPPATPLSIAQKDSVYKWIIQGAKNTTNCATFCNTSKFDYGTTIIPILETNCNGCHSGNTPSAGLNFKDYNVVKGSALNGSLMGSVKQIAPYKLMPPGGKLSDCKLEQLDNWVKAGAPNN